MKVKYIGFGGNNILYPCYVDENGRVYFDINDGKGFLNLYTGAYRYPEDDNIYGEPYSYVEGEIKCDHPFTRCTREYDYQMLSRLKSDCDYFLGCGNGCEDSLYYKNIESQCEAMTKLLESFDDKQKPSWITIEQVEKYRKIMIEASNRKRSEDENLNGISKDLI